MTVVYSVQMSADIYNPFRTSLIDEKFDEIMLSHQEAFIKNMPDEFLKSDTTEIESRMRNEQPAYLVLRGSRTIEKTLPKMEGLMVWFGPITTPVKRNEYRIEPLPKMNGAEDYFNIMGKFTLSRISPFIPPEYVDFAFDEAFLSKQQFTKSQFTEQIVLRAKLNEDAMQKVFSMKGVFNTAFQKLGNNGWLLNDPEMFKKFWVWACFEKGKNYYLVQKHMSDDLFGSRVPNYSSNANKAQLRANISQECFDVIHHWVKEREDGTFALGIYDPTGVAIGGAKTYEFTTPLHLRTPEVSKKLISRENSYMPNPHQISLQEVDILFIKFLWERWPYKASKDVSAENAKPNVWLNVEKPQHGYEREYGFQIVMANAKFKDTETLRYFVNNFRPTEGSKMGRNRLPGCEKAFANALTKNPSIDDSGLEYLKSVGYFGSEWMVAQYNPHYFKNEEFYIPFVTVPSISLSTLLNIDIPVK